MKYELVKFIEVIENAEIIDDNGSLLDISFLKEKLKGFNFLNTQKEDFERFLSTLEMVGYESKEVSLILFEISKEQQEKINIIIDENNKLRKENNLLNRQIKQSELVIKNLLYEHSELGYKKDEDFLQIEEDFEYLKANKKESGLFFKKINSLKFKLAKKIFDNFIENHLDKRPFDGHFIDRNFDKINKIIDKNEKIKKMDELKIELKNRKNLDRNNKGFFGKFW